MKRKVSSNLVTYAVLAIAVTLMVAFGLLVGCAFNTAKNQMSSAGSDSGKAQSRVISAEQAKQLMDSGKPYILVDVRSADEYKAQRIDGAVLVPVDQIATLAATKLPDKSLPTIVYCQSGARSARAAQILAGLGYTNVYDMGGIMTWPYGTVGD